MRRFTGIAASRSVTSDRSSLFLALALFLGSFLLDRRLLIVIHKDHDGSLQLSTEMRATRCPLFLSPSFFLSCSILFYLSLTFRAGRFILATIVPYRASADKRTEDIQVYRSILVS